MLLLGLAIAGVLGSGCSQRQGVDYIGRWGCSSGGGDFFEIKSNNAAYLVTDETGDTYPASLDDEGTLVVSGVPLMGPVLIPIDANSGELICSACSCARYTKEGDDGGGLSRYGNRQDFGTASSLQVGIGNGAEAQSPGDANNPQAVDDDAVRRLAYERLTYPIPNSLRRGLEVSRNVTLTAGKARVPDRQGDHMNFELSSKGPWFCDFDDDGYEEAFVVITVGPEVAANPGAYEDLGYLVEASGVVVDILDYERVASDYDRAFSSESGPSRVGLAANDCVIRAGGNAEGPNCCPKYSFEIRYQLRNERLRTAGTPTRRPFDAAPPAQVH